MSVLKTQARAAAVVCMVTTVVLSLAPIDAVPSGGVDDKWGHCLAYAATALTSHIGWHGRHRPYQLVLALMAAGAIIEVIQGFVGRHPDLLDFGADAIGASLGVGIAALTAPFWRSLTDSPR